MKKFLQKKTYFAVIIVSFLFFLVSSINWNYAQNTSNKQIETEVGFPNILEEPYIGFDLELIGDRKFKVILQDRSSFSTQIKVFDILGNLILESKINPGEENQKSFDFTHINSQIFVVEVGNSKFNKTKSIYSNPQGKRKVPISTGAVN